MLTWALWVITEWAVLVVLSVAALDRGGVRDVALVGVLRLLPAAAMAPLAARLTERLPRGPTVAGVELVWAALLGGLAATVELASAWPSLVLLGVASIASTVLRPSVNALVPEIEHDPARLTAVNSTYSVVEATASLAGPALTTTLLVATSARTTLIVFALVLVIAAVAAAGIRTERKAPARRRVSGRRRAGGLAVWLTVPPLRSVYLLFLVQTFVRGILNVLLVASAARLLGAASDAGLLFAAIGLGGLLGGLVAHAGVTWPAGRPFVYGMVAWGLPLLGLAASPTSTVAYAAMVVVGAANAVASVFGYTIVHRFVPDAVLGRAFAVYWSSVWTATAIGSYAAYGLVEAAGISGSFAIAGAALVLAALAAWPSVRSAEARLHVAAEDVQLLSQAAMFSPLSRVALEQLVRHARRVDVRPGQLVTVQGQIADDLYVIESGELQAAVDGVPTTTMGPGDCFGEIAALLETPRTATVRARSDARLLAIDGTAFVLAVTGHSRAERAAEDLVQRRMDAGRPGSGDDTGDAMELS